MSILDKEIECIERSSLESLQLEKLKKIVKYTYDNVKCFRDRMDEKGLKPSDVLSLDDLKRLPFSSKQDLRDFYPYGLLATDFKNVIRVHGSSGTTGKRIIALYTENDLSDWSRAVSRALHGANLDENDVMQVCYGYGLFTGGLGLHDGASKAGLTVIPASSGNTALQIQLLCDLKSTALACTPSYAMYLAEAINKENKKDELHLKSLILGAEPWTEEMRHQIEKLTGAKAYDIYGLTEITGPGVAYECECQCGMHINEDMFLAEIVDPNTGEAIEDGNVGELVFTTLNKEAMPLIRFRTHDLCKITKEKCKCGRTFARMSKVLGRTDDMIIVKGVNVFPSQIEETLLKFEDYVTPNYLIRVDRIANSDTFDIDVEACKEELCIDASLKKAIEDKIKVAVRAILGIGASIHLVKPNEIMRFEGKSKRVIDKRKLN